MIAQTSSLAIPNPFPVYPVASLADITSDILVRTVETYAVVSLKTTLDDHIRRLASGDRSSLAIPIRGDYGTGKTHLLTFAKAFLRKNWPNGEATVTILSAPATEVPFAKWYLTVVAPAFSKLDLPAVFARVLAAAACEVADQVPLTAGVAARVRADPHEVYPVIRDGLLSNTDVERALLRTVAAICPRGTEELRAVLAAMVWPQRQALALRWLCGGALEPREHELLGVTRDFEAEAESEAVLVAFAGASSAGGGLFALMIDEFEHLMAEDVRTDTQRNATAVKRLLQSLSAMGALVLVAGHWRAWEQLPDFRARFGGQAPLDLVTLSGKEIERLTCSYSPEWAKRLDAAAYETVAESSGRNIRRVVSLLHQLFADTSGTTGTITAEAAEAAHQMRQLLAAEPGRPENTIESAVLAAGGTVVRDEDLLNRKLRFDLVGRRGHEIQLVSDIRYAATTAALTRLLDDFRISVETLQTRHASARGLLIVTGAADPGALALLDAVPYVEALRGEGPGWEAALSSATTQAFHNRAEDSAPKDEIVLAQEDAAREVLRETRVEHEMAEAATRMRVDRIEFDEDARGSAASALARSFAPQPAGSIYGPQAGLLDRLAIGLQEQSPSPFSFLLSARNLPVLAVSLFAAGAIMAAVLAGPRLGSMFGFRGADVSYDFYIGFIFAGVTALLLTSLLLAFRFRVETAAFQRYQRWASRKLEEMLVLGAPGGDLLRLSNVLVDAPGKTGSYLAAFRYAEAAVHESEEAAFHSPSATSTVSP